MARAARKKQLPEGSALQKLANIHKDLVAQIDALGPFEDPAVAQRALRIRYQCQRLSQIEGQSYDAIADLVPLARERVNSRRRRREIVQDSQRTISKGVKDRLARIPILWEEEKKLHPNDLLDTRIEHVRAKLIAEGFRRGTSRDNFERDLKKLKEDGVLLD